jgi:hypothetical protein
MASNQDDLCPTPFSKADDVMVTSPSQSKDVYDNYSTPATTKPPEGKITAVTAVMRGNPKDCYTRHHSNKHYKQKLVQILLGSGSDGNLVFVSNKKTHAASLLKKAGSMVVEYFKLGLPDKA